MSLMGRSRDQERRGKAAGEAGTLGIVRKGHRESETPGRDGS